MALQDCLKQANPHFGEERDFERESRAEICDRTMTQIDRHFRMTFAYHRLGASRANESDRENCPRKTKV